ncbi:hypothetical protein VIGAN_09157400 [Vigna angularis var. angularis]|uniref:Uncharacterized protein n=1 Tax=Vigna angularis var. angularis TaxID=157739 RepID=A0A0S3SYH1_PHAAN|nr:hypothetical protein VIGAN_09157400 [Vigna angularis var. angularis]
MITPFLCLFLYNFMAIVKIKFFFLSFSKFRSEATLIENVVGGMQKEIIPRLACVTDNLVGIDSWMKEVISLMGIELNDIHFIGIWGHGRHR